MNATKYLLPVGVASHCQEEVWLAKLAHDSHGILELLHHVAWPALKGGWEDSSFAYAAEITVTPADGILQSLVQVSTQLALVKSDVVQAPPLYLAVTIYHVLL